MVEHCGCPVRWEAAELPPLPTTEENREKLKEFFVDIYMASTFNICKHQPLPMMHDLTLEFHLKDNAHPTQPTHQQLF